VEDRRAGYMEGVSGATRARPGEKLKLYRKKRVERRQSSFIRGMNGYNEGGRKFRENNRGRLNASLHIEREIPRSIARQSRTAEA
jgi:hypothetical protein